jgi:hypothetical protein
MMKFEVKTETGRKAEEKLNEMQQKQTSYSSSASEAIHELLVLSPH